MTDERQSDLDPREKRTRETVRSAGGVRADPVFRQRLKRAFISGTITEHAAPRRDSRSRSVAFWRWILVPAAVGVLLVFLFLPGKAPTWTVRDVRGTGRIGVEGRFLEASDETRLARSIGSGGRVRVEEGLALDLVLEDQLLLELDNGADLSLPLPPRRGSRGPLISEVRSGELRVKSGPGFSGRELNILTADGRTEIVGTVVSVYKGDDFTCVCVLEGTARIGANGARLEEVPSGMRKVMFGDGRPPLVTEIEPHHSAGLLEFVERNQDVFRSGR